MAQIVLGVPQHAFFLAAFTTVPAIPSPTISVPIVSLG